MPFVVDERGKENVVPVRFLSREKLGFLNADCVIGNGQGNRISGGARAFKSASVCLTPDIESVFARVQQSDHSRRKMLSLRNLTVLSALWCNEFFIPLRLCREKR